MAIIQILADSYAVCLSILNIAEKGGFKEMKERKWKWTKFQLNKLNNVQGVLKDIEKYKPLTLRQIYYQMVEKGFIPNKQTEYQMLSTLLTNARYDGFIDWDIMEDRSRRYINLRGYADTETFIRDTVQNWLNCYDRDLMQTQDKYIEIWTEKDALSTLFERVARQYTISVVVCRGFNSSTFLNNFKDRIRRYDSKEIILLYFGDFDPSGMFMKVDIENRLLNKLNVTNVDIKRVALKPSDNDKYNLFSDPDSLKETDPRTNWFRQQGYGNVGYELDALDPVTLENLTVEAIDSELDLDRFNEQVRLYNSELDKLGRLKQQATDRLITAL